MIKFEKIKEDVRKYFPELLELFKKDRDVVALYLFGSYGRDDIGPLSDVDIAVLLEPRVSSVNYFEKQLRLMRDACHLLHTDEVDLVILNEAPIDLQYAVLESGKLLYARDNPLRIRYETKIIERYLDSTRLRKEYFHFLKKHIREGRMVSGYRLKKYQQSLEQAKRMYAKTEAPK